MLFKKAAKWVLVASLAFPVSAGMSGPETARAAADAAGHWAKNEIANWQDLDLSEGYPDGTFRPDASITRAEFVALVNRVFRLKDKASVDFSDVMAGDWHYDEFAKARSAGYVSGYEDGTLRPNVPITRQEAAVVLQGLFQAKASAQNSAVAKFKDAGTIPSWSKAAIEAVVSQGYMNGYPDGSYMPDRPITRAEAVVTLDRAKHISDKLVRYDQAGTYREAADGSVIVSSPDVRLENMTIAGDLVLTQGVGEGNVSLKHVNVKGTTLVKGGGPNSILIDDSSLGTVVVNKKGGNVRLVAGGGTEMGEVRLKSGGKLEDRTGKAAGKAFGQVIVDTPTPAGSAIKLAGQFGDIQVLAAGVSVELEKGSSTRVSSRIVGAVTTIVVNEGAVSELSIGPNTRLELRGGTVDRLTVEPGAGRDAVRIDGPAVIKRLTINAPVALSGSGTIENAVINVNGASLDKAPKHLELGKDVTVIVAGKNINSSNIGTINGGGNGGSGSSGSGSSSSGSGSGDSSDRTAPAKPSNFRATAWISAVELGWKANTETDLKGYYIYRDGVKIHTASVTATTYTVTELTYGKPYLFELSAFDTSGNESSKASLSKQPLEPQANRAPVLAKALDDLTLTLAGGSRTISVASTFTDPDGDALTYQASSSSEAIVHAFVNGSELMVAPISVGSATVTVSVYDNKGGTAQTSFLATVVPAPNGDAEAAARDAEALTLGDTSAVTSDLTLPSVGPHGSTVTWATSNAALVSAAGKVTRPAAGMPDGQAMLTATVRKGAAVQTKTFNVTVKALSSGTMTDAEAVNKAKEALALTYNGYSASLALPANGVEGTTIVWSLKDAGQAGVIDPGTGKVTRSGLAKDVNVVLIATIRRGGAQAAKEFTLTVKMPQVKPAVNAVTASDAIVTGTVEPGAAVTVKTGPQTLGTAQADGVTGEFAVSIPPQPEGTVLEVSSSQAVGAAYVLVLEAGAMTDAQAVASAQNALTDTVILNGNPDVNQVTTALKLPGTGLNGTSIAWTSDNETVVSPSGAVKRPAMGENDASVKLTATISRGTAAATKTFQLLVKAQTKPLQIESIAPVQAAVDKNATYMLPAQVTANMSDGTTQQVNVSWNPAAADTSVAGTFLFEGTVSSYAGKAALTLTVRDVPAALTVSAALALATGTSATVEGYIVDADANPSFPGYGILLADAPGTDKANTIIVKFKKADRDGVFSRAQAAGKKVRIAGIITNNAYMSQKGFADTYASLEFVEGGTPQQAQLSYSVSAFKEATADDGSIDNRTPLIVTLANDTFTGAAGEEFVAAGKLLIGSLPAGLAVSAVRTSATQLTVQVNGKASGHRTADSFNNLTFTFANAAFTGGDASKVNGAVKNNLAIAFIGIQSIDPIAAAAARGAGYSLPAQVQAKMSDGSTKLVNVEWNPAAVDTSVSGTYHFEGAVAGYATKVQLTLTVSESDTTAPDVFAVNEPTSADDGVNGNGKSNVIVTWTDSASLDVDHYEIVAKTGSAPTVADTVYGQTRIARGVQTATFAWNVGENVYVGVVAVDGAGNKTLSANAAKPNVTTAADGGTGTVNLLANGGFESVNGTLGSSDTFTNWTNKLAFNNAGTNAKKDTAVKVSGTGSLKWRTNQNTQNKLYLFADAFPINPQKQYRVTLQAKLSNDAGATHRFVVGFGSKSDTENYSAKTQYKDFMAEIKTEWTTLQWTFNGLQSTNQFFMYLSRPTGSGVSAQINIDDIVIEEL
ncbi:immunoglobulin-like domain-containing protein [Paenibacillus tyrfis]|uniref:immunoglobulin-like domain-containing protein n=1 Tax=Paenibacillus tyrfis TaxID=1501230 RepID=UPI0020A17D77|nr:immunoglobulin-like domain-containing protein [Paenibacillus tyrfis]MCP1306934.1 S-layer homology domain-containing protein [Paenibacillus tyrfis]